MLFNKKMGRGDPVERVGAYSCAAGLLLRQDPWLPVCLLLVSTCKKVKNYLSDIYTQPKRLQRASRRQQGWPPGERKKLQVAWKQMIAKE